MTDTYQNMPDFTRTEGETPELGPMALPTEDGEVVCVQVPDLKTAHMTFGPGEAPVVAIFSYCEEGGVYVTLPVEAARKLAEALLRSADAAEQGYGVVKQ